MGRHHCGRGLPLWFERLIYTLDDDDDGAWSNDTTLWRNSGGGQVSGKKEGTLAQTMARPRHLL